jgi:putative endonuclease
MARLPWVYMLRCGDGSLYTGVAKDVDARLKQHQEGKGSRYTRAHLPVTLAWSKECATWGDSLKEEIRIKRLDREAKEKLVNGN